MAVQTIYLLGTAAVTPNFFGNTQLNGSAPTAANSTFGWSANKIAVGFIRGRLGATATASDAVVGTSYNAGTSGPTKGTGAAAGTAGDSFIAGPFNGKFAATAWTLAFNLRASTAGCVGHINVRIWKSLNAAGTSATQLLANTAGATVTLSTTADVNSSVSWSPGALSLNNEYLFFQIEWQETTLGTTNGDNVLFRIGTSSITTADFVAAAAGTGTPTCDVATLAASGISRSVGTSTLAAQSSTIASSGVSSSSGTSVLAAVASTTSGIGTVVSPAVGTGALVSISSSLAATGTVQDVAGPPSISTLVSPSGPFRVPPGTYPAGIFVDPVPTPTGAMPIWGSGAYTQVAQTYTNGPTPLEIYNITLALGKVGASGAYVSGDIVLGDPNSGNVLTGLGFTSTSGITGSADGLNPQLIDFYVQTSATIPANAVFSVRLNILFNGSTTNYPVISTGSGYSGGSSWTLDNTGGNTTFVAGSTDLKIIVNKGAVIDQDRFYFFCRDAALATRLVAARADGDPTSGGAAFTAVADVTGFDAALQFVTAFQVVNSTSSTLFHLAIVDGVSGAANLKWLTYDSLTDTFSTPETVDAGFNATIFSCGIVIRLNTTQPIICYNGPKVATFERCYWRTRTGVNTWTAAANYDQPGQDWSGARLTLGVNGDVMMFARSGANAFQRTLPSSNILDTAPTVIQNSVASPVGIRPAVLYANAGAQVVVPECAGSYSYYVGGSNPTSIGMVSNAVTGFPAQAYADLDGGQNQFVHILYRNNSGGISVITSTNYGATFSAPTVSMVASIAANDNALSRDSAMYQRGPAHWYLPYIVNDNGTWKYGEYLARQTISTGNGGDVAVVDTGLPAFDTYLATTAGLRSAQSFIAVGSVIRKVRLYFRRNTNVSTSGNIFVQVFTSDSSSTYPGAPLAQIGVTSSVLDSTTLTSDVTPYDFTFNPPVPVSAGITYDIVVGADALSDTSSCPYIQMRNTQYPDGHWYYDDGSQWVGNYLQFDLATIITHGFYDGLVTSAPTLAGAGTVSGQVQPSGILGALEATDVSGVISLLSGAFLVPPLISSSIVLSNNNLTATLQLPTVVEVPLVASYSPGADRNDFSGEVGISFTLLSDTTFTKMGLRCSTGNSGNYTVNLYTYTNPATLIRSVSVNLTGKTVGTFYYSDIAPYTLLAGQRYVLLVVTTSGGSLWPQSGAVTLNGSTDFHASYRPQFSAGFSDGNVNEMFAGVDLIAGPVPTFDPASYGGLKVWLDATQTATANPWTNIGSGPQPLIFGSPPPSLTSNVLNGHSVVRMNANEGRYRFSGTGVARDYTLVYVARMVGSGQRLVSGVPDQGFPGNVLYGYWNGNMDTAYSGYFFATGIPVTSAWKMYSADADNALNVARFFSNGVILGSASPGEFFDGYLAISGYQWSTPEETSTCDVAELLFYDHKLLDADRAHVEAYLRTKWGL
jgi:hypothetical protein